MKHEEAQDLLVGYVAGTLDADEREGLQDHLHAGCDVCEAAIRELSELAADISLCVPQLTPSPQVKEGIMAAATRQDSSRGALAGRLWHTGWAAAGLAAAAAGLLLYLNINLQREKEHIARNLAEARDITSLLSSPGMQFVSLEGVEPNEQAFGKVVLDEDRGAALVYMYRLPATPKDKEYQLWVMREGQPTNAGVFRVDEDGNAALKVQDLSELRGIAAFQVTIETEGGQPFPTGMTYLTGPVQR